MEVHIASDLWGRKHNLRTFFDHAPSLVELTVRAETLFGVETVARRPIDVPAVDVPPFRVVAMTILVDDAQSQWVDLISPKQLHDRCQVFVFQPPHPWHSDSRDLVPPPRDPLPPYPFASEETYRNELLRQAVLMQRPGIVLGGGGSSRGGDAPTELEGSPRRGGSASPRRALNLSASRTPMARHGPREEEIDTRTMRTAQRRSPVRVQSPVAPHERTRAGEVTNLDLAHEVFVSLDRHGRGRVHVAEVKAALVTVGLPASLAEDPVHMPMWEFNDWMRFCESNPPAVALIADHRGIRPAVYRATASPPRGRPSGASLVSATVNHHRDLSPQRSRQSESERQRAVAERLHGGFASIVTAKDRERGDYSHAEALLPHSPSLATARRSTTSPTSSTRGRARTPTRS
jgi:hypothetical protein